MTAAKATDASPKFVTFSARDADTASHRLHLVYDNSAKVAPVTLGEGFAMRMSAARIGLLTLTRTEMRNWSMMRETQDNVIVIIPESGQLTLHSGVRTGSTAPNMPFAVGRPFDSHRFTVDRGVGMALTAPVDGLTSRIERATGRPCSAQTLSRMVDQIDAASPIAQALARSARTAMAEMGGLHRLGLGAFASSGYEELLVNLMAAALLPEFAQPDASIIDCGTATVRRAREFIREHAAETIEISALAADLGVSMRALQQSFQRAYGFSPRDFIIECRLDLARHALQAHDQTQTIAEIAFASGFCDLSHFGAKYRDKYGETPSTTLRNASM